jgi:hypothetical protein
MEKEGLERVIKKLMEHGLNVTTLITDRHLQIAKWVRETLPDVQHFYDVWNLAKGIIPNCIVIHLC